MYKGESYTSRIEMEVAMLKERAEAVERIQLYNMPSNSVSLIKNAIHLDGAENS